MIEQPIIPEYKHIINPKLKYIHIKIDEKGEIIIKSSARISKQEITEILYNKREWIETSKLKQKLKKGKIPTFETNENTLYYLGNIYPIKLTKSNKQNIQIKFSKDSGFELFYNIFDTKLFQNSIDSFYKIASKKLITNIIDKQAKIMSVEPTAINFRRTKRQWGSCSSKNRLSFNSHIIKLPIDVIQYIIIHELSHIRHKHHQKAFWQEVERYCKDYKKLEAKLKEYQT